MLATALVLIDAVSAALVVSPSQRSSFSTAPTLAGVRVATSPRAVLIVEGDDTELESLFFSVDADSSGAIDRQELGDALTSFGFDLSEQQVTELFEEFDADNGGTIDVEEFKGLVKKVGIKPQRDLKFAMDLFQRYDEDKSGAIDKEEFKNIAREIQADNRRRTLISCVAAAAGSLVVAEYSAEYQWLQKTFRSLYIESEAERAQARIFPTAMLSGDLDAAIATTLARRGFTPKNTLFAHSICSDEVNNKDEQLVDLMVTRWQEGFTLGGLAGLPFAGKSGFRAYLHHVPDSGKLLVLFAPHVGIDAEGRIGALQREGQEALSKACGAAVGAFKAVASSAEKSKDSVLSIEDVDTDKFDPQLEEIVNLLRPRLKGIEGSADDIGFVTYQMYGIVRDKLDACIAQTPDTWDYATEVALVGGIIINRYKGGDFFQPLCFESRSRDAPPVDLFEQAFGKKPDLTPILGAEAAAKLLKQ